MENQEFEQTVQTFGAIAKLIQMQDLSGGLVQLHRYFADVLEETEDNLKAGEIVKFLIDLSEYILSWKEARSTLDKGFLHLCSKIIEDRTPGQSVEELEQEKVQAFFAKALELEPEVAKELMGSMKQEQNFSGE